MIRDFGSVACSLRLIVYRLPVLLRISCVVAALLAIVMALWQIDRATAGLTVEHGHLGTIPFTVFKRSEVRGAGPTAPVVVICHGFAGSQQMMQPFAVTLARNGYLAVTFDFPGHARNRMPLDGGVTDPAASARALMTALDTVVAFARSLPGNDGRMALLGHSMASDIVVRYAETHATIEATVAVSLFSRDVTASSPRNLLIVDGALEPAFLRDEAYRVVGLAAGGPARAGVTYGSFADGTARRLALADGAEHIGVLYSRDSMAEALAWLNGAFGRTEATFLDRRGPWLVLLYTGIVALGWPLSKLLPVVASAPLGSRPTWPKLLGAMVVPAVLTPLILWRLPTDFLPILLGDYVALHFALYGLLTFGTARLLAIPSSKAVVDPSRFAIASLAAAAYCLMAIAVPTDAFVTSYWPTPERAPLILAMLCGTWVYFAADEFLTRGARPLRGAYLVGKGFFLASLLAAVALNPKLFFLIIIVPAILIYFIVYGLFSTWIHRRTGHPLVGAFAAALAVAWGMAVTFPLVSP